MKTHESAQPQFYVGAIEGELGQQHVVGAYCPEYLPQDVIDAAMLALDSTASTITSGTRAPSPNSHGWAVRPISELHRPEVVITRLGGVGVVHVLQEPVSADTAVRIAGFDAFKGVYVIPRQATLEVAA